MIVPDYGKYKAALCITNNDIINAVRKRHPGFSKIQCSMINNQSRYGIQLTQSAEEALIEEFGNAEGLTVKHKTKREVKRTKPRRLACRVDEQTYDMVISKMRERGSESLQSFLEEIIKNI